jgi:hypothetical protein
LTKKEEEKPHQGQAFKRERRDPQHSVVFAVFFVTLVAFAGTGHIDAQVLVRQRHLVGHLSFLRRASFIRGVCYGVLHTAFGGNNVIRQKRSL